MFESIIYIPGVLNGLMGSSFFLKKLSPRSQKIESFRKFVVKLKIKDLKRNLANQGLVHGKTIQVERRKDLSEKEFITDYFQKNVPVIFNQQALKWKCCQNWSLDLIRDRFPDHQYNILPWPTESEEASKEPGFIKNLEFVKKISGKELVDQIETGNLVYLRGLPILEEETTLIEDLDLTWLQRMQRCWLGVSFQSFISSGKTQAPLHNESTSFFFIMIQGEKKWDFFKAKDFAILNPEPARIAYNFSKVDLEKIDPTKFPGIELLDRYTCTVNKGDILYVPAWMWHTVETNEPSWAISYKYTSLRGFLSQLIFVIDRTLLARPNIFQTLYLSFFKSDMGSRNNHLLIPKLFFGKKKSGVLYEKGVR